MFRQAYATLPVGEVMYIDLGEIQTGSRRQIPGGTGIFRKAEQQAFVVTGVFQLTALKRFAWSASESIIDIIFTDIEARILLS